MSNIPPKFRKYCMEIDDELIIKKPFNSNYIISFIFISILYIFNFYLFKNMGQGAFIIYIAVTSIIIVIGTIHIMEHYSPYEVKINFITGRVDMKGLLFKKERSFLISSDNLEPVSLSFDNITYNGMSAKYTNVYLVISRDITVESRTYCIMRFENEKNQEVHLEAEFLRDLLSNGFKKKISASELLKNI